MVRRITHQRQIRPDRSSLPPGEVRQGHPDRPRGARLDHFGRDQVSQVQCPEDPHPSPFRQEGPFRFRLCTGQAVQAGGVREIAWNQAGLPAKEALWKPPRPDRLCQRLGCDRHIDAKETAEKAPERRGQGNGQRDLQEEILFFRERGHSKHGLRPESGCRFLLWRQWRSNDGLRGRRKGSSARGSQLG